MNTTRNSTLFALVMYYVVSIILGIAMTVMGVYAFVQVYGWATLGGMLSLATIMQAWFWYTCWRHGKDMEAESLSNAVERHSKGE